MCEDSTIKWGWGLGAAGRMTKLLLSPQWAATVTAILRVSFGDLGWVVELSRLSFVRDQP